MEEPALSCPGQGSTAVQPTVHCTPEVENDTTRWAGWFPAHILGLERDIDHLEIPTEESTPRLEADIDHWPASAEYSFLQPEGNMLETADDIDHFHSRALAYMDTA